jgi:hypothetical protein
VAFVAEASMIVKTPVVEMKIIEMRTYKISW